MAVRLPVRRVTLLQIVIISITVAAATLLVQLWFGLLPADIAVKILTTCLVVGGVAGVIYAIAEDITAEDRQRRDKHLN